MKREIICGLLITTFGAVTAWAQSVWLPAEGQLIATPGFGFSTFDEFWKGRDRTSNPPNGKSLDQYTGFVSIEYGILPRLAGDFTVGYTATETEAFSGDSDSGLADTQLGLRYRLVDEQRVTPAVAVRVGGIIGGTYDENTPFSAGDGANGFEASLLFGKSFGQTGFGAYADIGYRVRETPVPDDIFGSVGVFKQFRNVISGPDALTFSAGYRHVQGLSGLDIEGSGWAPASGPSHGFPALREINQLFETSVGYTDKGGRQYQFTAAKSLAGRNTGDKLYFLFTVSLPVDVRR